LRLSISADLSREEDLTDLWIQRDKFVLPTRRYAMSIVENDIRVSEVWESREKLEGFGEKLRPRLEEEGIQLSAEPEVFEAHIFERF
jgi:hypothetical protein